MNTLFGIPMDSIMYATLSLFLVLTAALAILALRNRLLFTLALRNIPRRRAQTILIVVGLMLSTVIITSAFGTGDTISYSIRAAATTNLGAIDETVTGAAGTRAGVATGGATFIPAATVARVGGALAGDADVDGVMPATVVGAPLQDLTSGQTKDRAALAGIPTSYPPAFGPLVATDGATVRVGALGPRDVYINARAAAALNARVGDTLRVFAGNQAVTVKVRAILKDENLAAGGLLSGGIQSDPTVLMPLARVQALTGHAGQVTTLLISNRGDALGGAAYSDAVTARVRTLLANPRQVAAAQSLLRTSAGNAALATLIADPANAGIKGKLQELRRQLALPGQNSQLTGLLSDPQVSDALKTITAPAIAAPLNDALTAISDYQVSPLKQTALHDADLYGSEFTTIFVVFGLFSIASGVALIFLIFVMLAAERRAEMGMARAIGTRRRQLIQQFLFEGYVYDLGAALVGVALGIAVGLGMVQVIAALLGAADFNIQSHIEPRSLVVSFCLGALVTFLTVAISSWRVSRLNVVAAIRDLPADSGVDRSIGAAFRRPLHDLARAGRRLRRGRIAGAFTALGAALWHAIAGWGVFISRGVLLLPIGYLLASAGLAGKQEAPFSIGLSLLLIGAALLVRWVLALCGVRDAVRNRVGYSLAGIGLVVFWLLPFDALRRFGVPQLSGGIEMFFVSGIMLVIGAVWTVMYNSDLILGALLRITGSWGSLAPILKTAVTYPMQQKFRTGLTLGMFSLVIFTLMVMSVLVGSTAGSLVPTRDDGNYQIYGTANPNTPTGAIERRVAGDPSLRGVVAVGGLTRVGIGVRQPGQQDQRWQPYLLNVADNAYLDSTQFTLHARAAGYGSDQAVWRTLRDQPGYAVVDDTLAPRKSGNGGFGPQGFTIAGFHYEDTTFKPVQIAVRDAYTGTVIKLTVIGVLDQNAGNLSELTAGIYTGERTLTAAGVPQAMVGALLSALPTTYVFRTAPGADVHATALALGRTFLRDGLDVKEARQVFDASQAIDTGMNTMLQGFMALGLIVGIAALGVIAFRSVVERRQQIGMLRAIGFQRGMIRGSFLLESSFVALLGTLLGVLLGLGLAHNLVESLAKDNPAVSMAVPWLRIGLIVTGAYVASLATTYIPAWQASRVYPAEALRYE